MSVLLTGAGGLIGRYVLAALDPAADVVPVGRPGSMPGGRALSADLSSPTFTDVLPAGIDTIVHLAQSSRYRDFPEGADDVFAVNVGATARLLDWGRRVGIRRFVLASAGGAARVTDGHPLGHYLASKRAAELLAASYQGVFDVITLRMHFVYGRGQRDSALIPRLITAVRDGATIALAGPDGIRVTPTYAADAAAAVIASTRLSGSHVLDVGGPEMLSLRDIATAIGRRMQREPRFSIGPEGDRQDVIADVAATSAVLGRPCYSFERGLDDLLNE